MLPPRRIARYAIVVVRYDTPDPQLIISDYWNDWIELLYVVETSVLQVYTPLGRGYFALV